MRAKKSDETQTIIYIGLWFYYFVYSYLWNSYSNVTTDNSTHCVFWTEHKLHWTTILHGDKSQNVLVNLLETSSIYRCLEETEMPDVYKRDTGGHRNKERPQQLLGYTLRFSFKWRFSFICWEPHYEKPLKTCNSPSIFRDVQSSRPRWKRNKPRMGKLRNV